MVTEVMARRESRNSHGKDEPVSYAIWWRCLKGLGGLMGHRSSDSGVDDARARGTHVCAKGAQTWALEHGLNPYSYGSGGSVGGGPDVPLLISSGYRTLKYRLPVRWLVETNTTPE
jgi:hypothetical protein